MIFQLAGSALLLLLCAFCLRQNARAVVTRAPWWVVALDVAPLLLGTVLFASLSARPLLGALAVAGLTGGLIAADRVKRQVLLEPVVFSDRAELLELVRHPEFYLPFAGTTLVAAGGVAVVLATGAAAWALPPLWRWSPWPGMAALGMCTIGFTLPGCPPVLRRLQHFYEGLEPSRDPQKDSARWGMLACFIIHATLARAERPRRRAAPAVLRSPPARRQGPVIMAQLESFFDARRLHASLPANLLPGFDHCCASSAAHGALTVPTWGANTIRTEFAALTGLDADALGLDRFNAYERFARSRLDALPWRMQALGYQTICLHPFDKRFYGRHRAMPAMGFDRFIGPEAFPRTGRGHFVSDADLARKAAEILADHGPDLFLFVISVANHGPWLADDGEEDMEPLPATLQTLPEADALRRYLGGVRRTDTMFPILTGALAGISGSGALLAYGDHQPSLPRAFTALNHRDTSTDYVLWDAAISVPNFLAAEMIAVEALPQLLLDYIGEGRVRQNVAA